MVEALDKLNTPSVSILCRHIALGTNVEDAFGMNTQLPPQSYTSIESRHCKFREMKPQQWLAGYAHHSAALYEGVPATKGVIVLKLLASGCCCNLAGVHRLRTRRVRYRGGVRSTCTRLLAVFNRTRHPGRWQRLISDQLSSQRRRHWHHCVIQTVPLTYAVD